MGSYPALAALVNRKDSRLLWAKPLPFEARCCSYSLVMPCSRMAWRGKSFTFIYRALPSALKDCEEIVQSMNPDTYGSFPPGCSLNA